jgi:adenylyl-sulfate kinase
MANKGFTLWFTGLSGAGKSTLSNAVAEELRRRGRSVERLDGDEVRERLSRGLGFTKQDRDENVRRIGFVARLLSRNGTVAIAAAISPYREVRDEVRRTHDAPFVEIFVECPLEVLITRDPKGLYAKALRGDIANFSGVSDPYEPPLQADITVHTGSESVEASRDTVLRWLEERHLI